MSYLKGQECTLLSAPVKDLKKKAFSLLGLRLLEFVNTLSVSHKQQSLTLSITVPKPRKKLLKTPLLLSL